jgi:hypothetical protein
MLVDCIFKVMLIEDRDCLSFRKRSSIPSEIIQSLEGLHFRDAGLESKIKKVIYDTNGYYEIELDDIIVSDMEIELSSMQRRGWVL